MAGIAKSQHSCKDPNTLPILITFNQRLTFNIDLLDKNNPGFSKEIILPKSNMRFGQVIDLFVDSDKYTDDGKLLLQNPPSTSRSFKSFLKNKPYPKKSFKDYSPKVCPC